MLEKGIFKVFYDVERNCMVYTIEIPMKDLADLTFTKDERTQMTNVAVDGASVPMSDVLDALNIVVKRMEEKLNKEKEQNG